MRRLSVILSLLLASTLAAPVRANVLVGDPAPAFTKARLGGGNVSLSDYSNQVLVLFLFGYDCPFCLNDAPSLEANVHQRYDALYPGQVSVLGVDLWNGTSAQVSGFRDQTGVTFPLLLNGSLATGGNLATLYGPYDNYLVVNAQGIVRYHAANLWPHGNRYHLGEIQGAIDSLVTPNVGVPDPGDAGATVRFSVAPNPFREDTRVELSLPAAVEHARVTLHDVTGRRLATLHEGPLAAGTARLDWKSSANGPLAAGVYFVAAELDGRRLHRRVVRLP